jgi:hypothetical protein
MNNLTRRRFLTTGTAGFAAAAALSAIPAAAAVLRQSKPAHVLNPSALSSEPLVAHVVDLERGEVLLMVGPREVALRDVELAHHLYSAAQRSL